MTIDNNNRIGDWLESALHQYGQVTPRPGLEGRILASLSASRKRWWCGRSAVWSLASIILLFVLFCLESDRRHEQRAKEAPAQTPFVESPKIAIAQTAPPKPIPTSASRKQNRAALRHQEARPLLFPSPQPLSQEELAMARYARHFPHEAVLVAEEQQRFDEEIRQAEAAMGSMGSKKER